MGPNRVALETRSLCSSHVDWLSVSQTGAHLCSSNWWDNKIMTWWSIEDGTKLWIWLNCVHCALKALFNHLLFFGQLLHWTLRWKKHVFFVCSFFKSRVRTILTLKLSLLYQVSALTGWWVILKSCLWKHMDVLLFFFTMQYSSKYITV